MIIDWCFSMPDGSNFDEPAWTELREAAKLYVWSLHADPPPNRRPSHARSLPNYFPTLRTFIHWMAENEFRTFTDLHSHNLDTFFAYVANRPGNRNQQKIAPSTLVSYKNLLQTLHRQGRRYPSLKIPNSLAVAEFSFQKSDRGSLPRTPDEIAYPLITAALRLIETPASDIITLWNTAHDTYSSAKREGFSRGTCRSRALSSIAGFRFATLPDENAAWYPHPITRTSQITYLVDRIQDAAFVLLSYLVGMRGSESLGLEVGCSTPRPVSTPDDPPDVFFISGRILKTSSSPTGDPHRWVAPACVNRAVHVLEQLSAPLRSYTGSPYLWLTTGRSGMFHNPSSIAILSTTAISLRLNEQFAPFVDLPLYNGKPWHFSTHQGRIFLAGFIGRFDKTGLDALRAHFGHTTIAMTDSAYVRNDADFNDLINEHVRQETHDALVEILTAPDLGGQAGQSIAQKSQFRGRLTHSESHDYAKALLRNSNVTIGLCDYGYCVFRPGPSACLGNDSGPNPVLRSESTCAGCANFVVTRKQLPFWQQRRARNLKLLQTPGISDSTREVAEHRVSECDRIISSLQSTKEMQDATPAP